MNQNLNRHIVLGMAGHIDHGKTEIVKALTGTNTDRLKEEKERGMTTDLGFAFLGDDITIIDVPGHEKFIKTMVAGVNTVDLALLVIAADDGIMPQTREHLEILNLLRVPTGLVAVSKIDLVESDWLQMVLDDIPHILKGTVMENAPLCPVSPVTGEGVDGLKETIFRVAAQVHHRQDKGIFRLPIDRVFTMKGFGTVIAGTVLSGQVSADDTVELLPHQSTLRVRGIQVHGKSVETSTVGFRTAINLMNIEKDTIVRGDVLAEPGFFRPTSMMDAHFTLLPSVKKELKNRARVHVHIGTSEVTARLVFLDKKNYLPGDEGFIQLHFEKPVTGDRGDRFVIRSYSPVRTIGGGVFLDIYPKKHKPFDEKVLERLKHLSQGDPNQIVLEHLKSKWFTPQMEEEIARALGMTKEEIQKRLQDLSKQKDVVKIGKKRWIARENLEILHHKILTSLNLFIEQNPLRLSLSGAELRSRIRQNVDKNLFDEVARTLESRGHFTIQGDKFTIKKRAIILTSQQETIKNQIEKIMLDDPMNPPRKKELVIELGRDAEAIISFMLESKELILLGEDILLHQNAVDSAKKSVQSFLKEKTQATVSEIKAHWGTTRKYAVPLLVYFDNIGLTEREGDVRKLKT